MKEKELYIEFEPQQLVYYVEKDDDSYGPVISGSQLSANYLDDFWEKRIKLEENLRKQIAANKITPVYYYMILQEMGPKDLAKRIGLSYRKLQNLFKPKHFKKLKIKTIIKFAEIFNIPVSSMFQTCIIKDTDKEITGIEHMATNNECYNITKIFVKKK